MTFTHTIPFDQKRLDAINAELKTLLLASRQMEAVNQNLSLNLEAETMTMVMATEEMTMKEKVAEEEEEKAIQMNLTTA